MVVEHIYLGIRFQEADVMPATEHTVPVFFVLLKNRLVLVDLVVHDGDCVIGADLLELIDIYFVSIYKRKNDAFLPLRRPGRLLA